jgi:inner membrane protein
MDPISQAALGAVVGQAAGHDRLGRRAAVVGAAAGTLPDIDVLFTLHGDLFAELVLHRGITHSLAFVVVAGPLLGYLAYRIERWRSDVTGTRPPGHQPPGSRLPPWLLVTTLALLSHPLLDAVTSYGTQLLQPFSNARFAIDAMPIIDPLYTLVLLCGLFAGARLWRTAAQPLAQATLLLSCAYVGHAWWLNVAAEREAARQLADEGITGAEVAAFPTILQVHHRRVVARTPEHDRVGFISMWQPCPIVWTEAPRQREHWAVQAFLATREGRIFDWFTMGWGRYHLTTRDGELWVRGTDLRYGFTADPNLSVFMATARVDPARRRPGPVIPGRDTSDATAERLAVLFRPLTCGDPRP